MASRRSRPRPRRRLDPAIATTRPRQGGRTRPARSWRPRAGLGLGQDPLPPGACRRPGSRRRAACTTQSLPAAPTQAGRKARRPARAMPLVAVDPGQVQLGGGLDSAALHAQRAVGHSRPRMASRRRRLPASHRRRPPEPRRVAVADRASAAGSDRRRPAGPFARTIGAGSPVARRPGRVVGRRSANAGVVDQPAVEGEVGLDARRSRVSSSARRSRAIAAGRSSARTSSLASSGSYSGRRAAPLLHAGVDPHARPSGSRQRRDAARRRREVAAGSSALIRTSIAWPARARLHDRDPASGSPAAIRICQATMSTPLTSSVTPCSTCSRVFISRNQYPPVGVEQELDRRRVVEADRPGARGARSRPAPRALGVDRRRRASPRPASGGGAGPSNPARPARQAAVAVAQQLHLDVAGALDQPLERTPSRRRRPPAPRGRPRQRRPPARPRSSTRRMPRPPPPAAAFSSSGKPTSARSSASAPSPSSAHQQAGHDRHPGRGRRVGAPPACRRAPPGRRRRADEGRARPPRTPRRSRRSPTGSRSRDGSLRRPTRRAASRTASTVQ